MKKTYVKLKVIFLAVISLWATSASAQVPLENTDVMLQGFYWNSHSNTKWTSLNAQAEEISTYFDMIWLPPAAEAEFGGSSNVGYHPYKWASLNSSWGNKSQLQTLISSLHDGGCKVIADIVINHRAGTTSCTFPKETFGDYGTHQFLTSHICKDDEGSCTGKSPNNDYKYNATDGTSGKYPGARDLDHTIPEVREHIKAYLKWMKNDVGFDGWRYDLVKGYDPVYTKEYNVASQPYFSVGEYYDGDFNRLKNWVEATDKKSAVFDFNFKFAVRDWGGTTTYSKLVQNYGGVDRPAGLIRSPDLRQYAVTFIDNHDTSQPHHEGSGNRFQGDVGQAHAFMLSSAGTPCVFWRHWVSHKYDIKNMIVARKAVGLHSNSDVVVTNKTGYYESKATGKCGELICRIGGDLNNVPAGFTKACSGNGWAYYTKISGTACETVVAPAPDPAIGSITIRFKAPTSWSSVKIWAWDAIYNNENYTGNAWPGISMNDEGNGYYSYSFSNVNATTMGVVINNGNPSTGKRQTMDMVATGNICWKTSDSYLDNQTTYYNVVTDNACTPVSTGKDPEVDALAIYPNPVDDVLNIFTDKEISVIEILNASGTLLKTTTDKTISVTELSKGMYIVKVSFTDNSSEVQKFIKQ